MFYEEGEQDFSSHVDNFNIFPLRENEQIMNEQVRDEQQELATPPISLTSTTHEDSSPSFKKKKREMWHTWEVYNIFMK